MNKEQFDAMSFLEEDVYKQFEIFWSGSPFKGAGDRVKIAMKGSYLAGWALCAQQLKDRINITPRTSFDGFIENL